MWRGSHSETGIRTYFVDAIELRLNLSQEHAMKKIILVAIAVLLLPTITPADARAAKQRTIHRQVVMGPAVNPALLNANASLNGAGTDSDRAMHMRNLRDSGYNPKNDYNAFGVMSVAD
jgi:hypothetical protein